MSSYHSPLLVTPHFDNREFIRVTPTSAYYAYQIFPKTEHKRS